MERLALVILALEYYDFMDISVLQEHILRPTDW